MQIQYSRKSLKFLKKQPKQVVSRIVSAIQMLADGSPNCDVKAMQGSSNGEMRIRVGTYRVIYRIDTDGQIEILLVLDIGNRGDIYK